MSLKKNILLIDLPTYPKGVLSLSLINVGTALTKFLNVDILDLNLIENEDREQVLLKRKADIFGFKVSSQNLPQAILFAESIKKNKPDSIVLWGGELPSLLPNKALEYCDIIVKGQFDEIVVDFIKDLENDNLEKIYDGTSIKNPFSFSNNYQLQAIKDYSSVMGVPVETSKGCTEKCAFCMVHVMQKKTYNLKEYKILEQEIAQLSGNFLNIIDYNFGVSAEHVLAVAAIIKKHAIKGWMAEMCIELLDNKEVLQALKDSNCRIIYCGLETLEQEALESVHKMNTNHIENYQRIIKLAQSYDVQIASGVILGIKGSSKESFQRLFDFHQEMSTIYTKLTFLTYNPGTAVKRNMAKKGTFPYEEIHYYDGNHFSYVPAGVDEQEVLDGAEWFIKEFYSLRNIWKRNAKLDLSVRRKIENFIFAYNYGLFYKQWLKHNALRDPIKMSILVNGVYKKSLKHRLIEKLLYLVRC